MILAMINNKGGVGKTTRTPRSFSWWRCRVALFAVALGVSTLALVLLATRAQAGEARGRDDLTPLMVPDGGRVVQEGDRLEIYDAKSRRVGYGYVRPDGSVDLFNTDGTRRATIQPGPGGRVRVTVPKGGRR